MTFFRPFVDACILQYLDKDLADLLFQDLIDGLFCNGSIVRQEFSHPFCMFSQIFILGNIP